MLRSVFRFGLRNMSSSAATVSAPKTSSIVEGKARIACSENEQVFYNNVQILNRDLSIQVINLFAETRQAEREKVYAQKLAKFNALLVADGPPPKELKPPRKPMDGITVLDALAATGLRSVRYLKEIRGVRQLSVNDIDPTASEAIYNNMLSNGIREGEIRMERSGVVAAASEGVAEPRVRVHTGDGAVLMYQNRDPITQFDVIDLDPYGSCAPFLDAAVQSVANGGLMCVTCTDMSVFCGNYPEKCFALYGAIPLKAKFTHEQALRILLHNIEATAAKYKRHIEPWVSMGIDYYQRVWVRVWESPAEVKRSALKRAMVHQSTQCGSFYLQPLAQLREGRDDLPPVPPHCVAPLVCPETGGRMKVGGPIWSAPIHDQGIVDELLRRVAAYSLESSSADGAPMLMTQTRVTGLLTAMSEELKDCPLYYYLPDICSAVHSCTMPMVEFQSALLNAGFRVSQFHKEPLAVKTDAPPHVIWDIMREYCRLHPPQEQNPASQPSAERKKRKAAGMGKAAPDVHAAVGGDGDKVGAARPHQSVSKAELRAQRVPDASVRILSNPSVTKVDFTIHPTLRNGLHAAADGNKKRIARFPPNPEANWGPRKKSTTNSTVESGLNTNTVANVDK